MSTNNILFIEDIEKADKLYMLVRNERRYEEERRFLEQMWANFVPYADKHFRQQLVKQFHQRFWEMYLGNAFLELRFRLDPNLGDKPDLCVLMGKIKVWVEATAPRRGTGENAVPELRIYKGEPETTLEAHTVPSEEIILRFTNAIDEKIKKYIKYIDKKIISSDDPYIIALNGADIGHEYLEEDRVPRILKAIFPIGDFSVTLDTSSEKTRVVRSGYLYRPSLTKRSGGEVSTAIFLNPDNSGISGLLYSRVHLNALRNFTGKFSPSPFGIDFHLIHNPMASNPVPYGWLKIGLEYSWENGQLCIKRWS